MIGMSKIINIRVKTLSLIALLAALAFTSACWAAPSTNGKLMLVSWDAAADWIVDRLLDEGKMPNVAALCAEGVRAEYVVPSFPSVTGSAHATLWTGAWPNTHGIVGNKVPLIPFSSHTPLESMSGFDSAALLAEPVWMAAIQSGKRVTLLSAAQSEPPDVYYSKMAALGIPKDRLTVVTGRFEKPLARAAILANRSALKRSHYTGLPAHTGAALLLPVRVGNERFKCFFLDAVSNPTLGYDTAVLRSASGNSWVLKPGWSSPGSTDKFSPPISIKAGKTSASVRFRLFDLAANGSSFMLYHTAALRLKVDGKDLGRSYPAHRGGESAAPFKEYAAQKLGKTLWNGGNGDAERRLLETVRLGVKLVRDECRCAISSGQWDLLMSYSPFPDTFEHIVVGSLDEDSRSYRPDVAAAMWPFLYELYVIHDEWLGELMKLRPPDCIVALVSDHGMQGVSRTFYANAALRDAGLLSIGRGGAIDLARTKALSPAWFPSGIVINDDRWKSGMLTANERENVIQAVRLALCGAIDPDTGSSPVTAVYDAPDQTLSLGGTRSPDLVFDLDAEYTPDPKLSRTVAAARGGADNGSHGFPGSRPKMRAVFFASGPGLERGAVIEPMDSVSVIPMLCNTLGWRTPAQAANKTSLVRVQFSGSGAKISKKTGPKVMDWGGGCVISPCERT